MARFLCSSVLLLSALQLCLSKPVKRWDDLQVKHAWVNVPRGWELVGPAPADHKLNMRIGLKQDRLDELISSLFEVSDPTHVRCVLIHRLRGPSLTLLHRYGAHLSKEDVDALVSPHPESVNTVDSWLTHHGVDEVSRTGAGDWVSIIVPVSVADQMFGTNYNVYKHITTSETIVRTLNYSLPLELHDHIDVVTPTTYFGTTRAMRATSFVQPKIQAVEEDQDVDVGSFVDAAVPSSCKTTITPACLIALYNTTGYVPKATASNSLGIAGYLDQYAIHADLQVCCSFMTLGRR